MIKCDWCGQLSRDEGVIGLTCEFCGNGKMQKVD